jgi:hypothetical protein
MLLAQGLARRDREALAVAAVLLLGAALLRVRSGLVGLVLLCLSFANRGLWSAPSQVV